MLSIFSMAHKKADHVPQSIYDHDTDRDAGQERLVRADNCSIHGCYIADDEHNHARRDSWMVRVVFTDPIRLPRSQPNGH